MSESLPSDLLEMLDTMKNPGAKEAIFNWLLRCRVRANSNEREQLLLELFNNFHGNLPGGWRWESRLKKPHETSYMHKGGEDICYGQWVSDVEFIVQDLGIPYESMEYQNRCYDWATVQFNDFKVLCRLADLGYDLGDMNR